MRSVLFSLVALTALACGDDADTTTDTTTADTAAETSAETTTPETTTPETTTPETTTPETTTPETSTPTRVEAECSEAGYTDCFVNDDCPAAERCENMSANALEIPCCVAGTRGTGVTGEPCTSENDCETSLCISFNEGPTLCSGPCGDPSECPESASDCRFGLCVPGD